MKKKTQSTKQTQTRAPKKPVKANDESNPIKAKGNAEATANEDGDIVDLILRDHLPLKDLIEKLKNPDSKREEKQPDLEDFVLLLKCHAKAEEQSLYVEMKEHKELRIESFEGDTEHAIAEQLMQEINATPDDDEWTAKVKVLAEMVEHHIDEEEGDMLPQVKEAIDDSVRIAVGERYLQLKSELDVLNHLSSTREVKRLAQLLN